MKNVKIYVCAGLFVVLTALKLLLPGQALYLRQQVQNLVERDDDYAQMIAALGQKLSETDPVNSLIEVFRLDGEAEGTDETIDSEPEAPEQAPASSTEDGDTVSEKL